jgi:phosphoribosylformimino-5-aminoimidazole carboxamide ribotide isomerase
VPFDVIPAIDLADSRVVRLVQGRFDTVTDFGGEPLTLAHRFWREGARSLHVIDLDAARSGERPPAHLALIQRLASERPADGVLQVGGGFRTEEAVDAAIALGVDRVLIGTVAFRDPALLDRLVARYGDRICVTADALDGTVRVAGWAEDAGVQVVDAIQDLSARGVGAFLVTAIERDGTLAGHDLRLLEAVRAATDGILLASGGVGTVAHVVACRDAGANGVVVGRALLSGAITLPETLAAVAVRSS